MKYTVKTTAGITFLFRNVSELEYNAEKSSLFVQLPGMKFTAHGVTSIKGEEDDEPFMNSFNIIGGGYGGGSEKDSMEDPVSLVASSRFAVFDGLEVEVSSKSRRDVAELISKSRSVIVDGVTVKSSSKIRNANKRGIPLQ